jgi:tRNA(adenine34) deaminase
MKEIEEEIFSDAYFMRKALDLACQAFEEDEVPIGAVVVYENKIIGKGYNQTEKLMDVTAHAEMLAITSAAQYMNSKFLEECTLYVTIEPCVMCGGALKWARFNKVVFGASEPKFGYSIVSESILYHKTNLVKGVLADECAAMMRQFFAAKRK